jgi:hypothetical protein
MIKIRYQLEKTEMNKNESKKDKRLESHKDLIQDHVLRNGSISCSLFERILCVKLNNVFYFIIDSISSISSYTEHFVFMLDSTRCTVLK